MTDPKDSIYPVSSGHLYHGQSLTKREYFAGLALQGLLAGDVESTFDRTVLTKQSVEIADLLIITLNR